MFSEKDLHETPGCVLQKYYKDFPTILLGDFNSDVKYEDAAINILLNISDTGCAAFDPSKPQNTFDSDSPTERLDYIFYNEKYIDKLDAKKLACSAGKNQRGKPIDFDGTIFFYHFATISIFMTFPR